MKAMINLKLLMLLHDKCARRVRYRMGAKAPGLTADSAAISHLDCSGFVRWVLARASRGALVLPDGSTNQRAWCEQHLRRIGEYSHVRFAAQDPGRVFVAFLAPSAIRPRSAGHVWLVRAGVTLESCSGKGVCSRPWDTPVLRQHASATYEVPVAR